jgi:hypothetical protein
MQSAGERAFSLSFLLGERKELDVKVYILMAVRERRRAYENHDQLASFR